MSERMERVLDAVALELSEHRRVTEATGKFFATEKVLEGRLEETLFLRGQSGWEIVSLTLIPDEQPGIVKDNVFLVVFRREDRLDNVP